MRPQCGDSGTRRTPIFCSIRHPDGTLFECDTRGVLIRAVEEARKEGLEFDFGPEMEFYLFKLDELGGKTYVPYDDAGYMDIAPEDKGENVRREICLMLEQMDIEPESSHHEEGPGQNEIDFRYSDALTAADNAQTFKTVVKTVAGRNGLWADFSPKPLEKMPGNGFHVNISVRCRDGSDRMPQVIAGILRRVNEMTAILNPHEDSFTRFGTCKAPAYVTWSAENRSQLVRVPAATGSRKRVELRSPDPTANPYLVFALLIRAAMEGIREGAIPPPPADLNFFTAGAEELARFPKLPLTKEEAVAFMRGSTFIRASLPEAIVSPYCAGGSGR